MYRWLRFFYKTRIKIFIVRIARIDACVFRRRFLRNLNGIVRGKFDRRVVDGRKRLIGVDRRSAIPSTRFSPCGPRWDVGARTR